MQTEPLDLIAIGELLIDMISTNYADALDEAAEFRQLPGGSPANLAANVVRLGKRAALVATIGNDAAGGQLRGFVQRLGLDITHLRQVAMPSTLILVTRSRQVSQFEAYRMADAEIVAEQLPADWLRGARLLHTTCFALSRDPARTAILTAAETASRAGLALSLDANYAQKIWPDREQARQTVATYLAYGAIVKFSEVDWHRLFGEPLTDPAAAAHRLLGLGARIACLTLGEQGCYVSDGKVDLFLPARTVEVKDTTGAGDAFWGGFLTAWLDGYDCRDCARAGRAMAEKKLGYFGPLPDRVNIEEIYEDVVGEEGSK